MIDHTAPQMQPPQRKIHIDMDAFYTSVAGVLEGASRSQWRGRGVPAR